MHIVAHGIDVVEIERIHREINAPGSIWIFDVYSAQEQGIADSGPLRYRFFAGRYAGKEAIAKALGTGFTGDITWQGIEILRSENGAPRVKLSGDALLHANYLGISDWLISITYSSQLAFASAIALGDPIV